MLELVKKHLGDWKAGNWSEYKASFADDAEYVEMATQQHARGPDAIVDLTARWKRAFPDLDASITSATEAAGKVFVELEWTGTHQGPLDTPFGAIEATGNRGSVPGALVYSFEGDKIVGIHHYFDIATVLMQVGGLPGAKPQAEPHAAE